MSSPSPQYEEDFHEDEHTETSTSYTKEDGTVVVVEKRIERRVINGGASDSKFGFKGGARSKSLGSENSNIRPPAQKVHEGMISHEQKLKRLEAELPSIVEPKRTIMKKKEIVYVTSDCSDMARLDHHYRSSKQQTVRINVLC